ncbi:hypothetical protein [Paraburkholderia kururiensis]|uniref:hypothetical protein n=1 Tax=Paraburkholderia kururiensis TaxID=984307 RepID=UPI000F863856|nr:hypothetical protein [Paraburkholderia kururiensis]
MSDITLNLSAGALPTNKNTATMAPRTIRKIMLAVALLTSAMSLGITVFGGMQRAATVTEQVWSVGVSVGAVLCVNVVPMLWRYVRWAARMILVALWFAALYVVLTGQMDVLARAQQHAADQRAQTVPIVATPSVADGARGRSLTTITQDIAKVSIELAHVEVRRCTGECPSLHIRKAALSAELATLNAEATEAKRRATEQDWLRDQASRAEVLRESRRAQPGIAMVAHWLGTTEARQSLLRDLACVVVLEGLACFAWYFVGLGTVVPSRKAVAPESHTTVMHQETVAPILEVTPAGCVAQATTQVATAGEKESIVNDSSPDVAMSEDDQLIAKIHEEVAAGRLTRNLASIRKFLKCGQSKAIRLNRLYIARFGDVRSLAGLSN